MCLSVLLNKNHVKEKRKLTSRSQEKKFKKKLFDYYKIVAEKDIVVYKYLEVKKDKLISPYQGKKYILNTLYTSGKTFPFTYCISFSGFYMNFDRGLHSYQKKSSAEYNFSNLSKTCSLFKCIIPKGSVYFKGTVDEIVSNQLIIVEEIKKN